MNFDKTATEASDWTQKELEDIHKHILDMNNIGLPQVAFDRIDLITDNETVISLFEGLQKIGALPEEVLPMVASRVGIQCDPEDEEPALGLSPDLNQEPAFTPAP